MTKTSEELLEGANNEAALKDYKVTKMLRCRVRYFTEGGVIRSKNFVNEVFMNARERFETKRKDGARKLKGGGAAASGSLRDLQKGGAWAPSLQLPIGASDSVLANLSAARVDGK